MPELRPFHGVRYSTTDLKDLVCPPYDVISADEQDRLYRSHPHNAARLELARGEDRYEAARSSFEEWVASGILQRDTEPAFYVYRQDFVAPTGERKRVVGVIGALTLEPFGERAGVLPHERTMPGPKEDRLALMRALPVNVSPIYAIYRGARALEPFFESLDARPTAARISGDDGILHRLWVVTAPAEIELLSAALRPGPLVIADGHHRYETALAFRDERGGPGEHEAIMCFCVDADGADLVVLPYNRALKARISPDELERRLVDSFTVSPAGDAADDLSASKADHPFVFVLPGRRLLVEAPDAAVTERLGERAASWLALDVVALHEGVFPRVLPEGIDELSFSKDPEEIIGVVEEGGWTAGVLLRALGAAQVVDVARSGERMPQKASYFWPKPITGLVFRRLA